MQRTNQNITYSEMVARFGDATAHDLMRTIEKLAKVQDNIIHRDEDIRFQKALNALQEVNS